MARTDIQIATGTYTGNGSASARAIEVGFEPELVIVVRGTGASIPLMKQPGDLSRNLSMGMATAVAAQTTGILHSTETGFMVLNAGYTNANASPYYWFAMRAPKGALFSAGYYGTTAALDVADEFLSFEPDFLWVMTTTNGVSPAYFKINDGTTDSAVFGPAAKVTTAITDIADGQFSLGTSANVNAARQYLYTAFKNHSSCVASGVLTGDAAARSIDLGFAPALVLVKNMSTTAPGVMLTTEMQAGAVEPVNMDGTGFSTGNLVLTSSGFNLSDAAAVNGSGNKIAYMAFAAGSFTDSPVRASA